MSNGQQPKEQTTEQKACGSVIGCLFLLPLLAGGGVFLLMSSPSSSDKPDTASSQPEASAPADTGSQPPDTPAYALPQTPKPGTAGRLDFNGEPVLVATTELVASQITNDIDAKNVAALSQLEKNGEAYIVDDDTPAVFIKSDQYLTGVSVYQVRIAGGSYEGKEGWIPGEYFR